MGDLAARIRSERLDLIELLQTLPPEDWAADSLCTGWTVQDVSAHLAWSPALRPLEAVVGVARGGFRLNKINADNARGWSIRGQDAILDQLRANAEQGLRPPGTPEAAALADAVCHAIDIRRPLGRPAPMSAESFPAVADFFAGLRWPLTISIGGHVRATISGVRLVADDLAWSHGAGPEVHGRAESLLMVLTGRPVADNELEGPGAQAVYARL